MNGSLDEWIEKAEGDYRVASREIAANDAPNYDAVCFHAQQCVEKLMKALLIKLGQTPPKIHDLRKLDRLTRDAGVDLDETPERLHLLSKSAVLSRYPGESADRGDALAALEICNALRSKLLAFLNS